jgi:hypothetical protein
MICHILLFALISLCSADVFWTDWKDTVIEDGVTKYRGEITVTRPSGEIEVVEVKYSHPIGIAGFQYDSKSDLAGYDWYKSGNGYSGSPYTSAVVPNRPPAYECIRLRYAGVNTLEFSRNIGEPIFAYLSLNGNGYGFDKDFTILSSGEATRSNCGYWGCGTSVREVHETEEPIYKYWLVGTGEPHGTLQFLGSFNKLTWKSLSNENWNGFTLGVVGLAEDVPSGQPCTEQDCKTWERNTITGKCDYKPIVCPSDPCNDGICYPGTGCVLEAKTGFASCDDGDACTENDQCDYGECSGTPIECEQGQNCQKNVCKNGNCEPTAAYDYEDCEDGDDCTQGDICQAGVCVSGPSIACLPAPGSCKQSGKCVAGGCEWVNKADGATCEDGNLCTTGDTCKAGVCQSGTVKSCAILKSQCHKPGVCDPDSGVCNYDIFEDGTPCEDGNACSGDDSCQAGKCVPGKNKLCCRTNGPNGKCGLCVRKCEDSYQSVLMFFGLKGTATNVCGLGGRGDCPNETDVCCAPKDQKTTIKYLEDGTCYRVASV